MPTTLRSSAQFEALYRTAWPRVVDYLRFRIGPDDAADVAAEVFVRAWKARAQYAPDRGEPEAWLWGIARNAARDHRRAPRPPIDLDAVADVADASLAEHGAGVEATARVAVALAMLEPIDRDIVALRFGGGLPFREVGAAVGLTEAAAATRLHRAIKRLRSLLEETER
ncbi:MAG: RNA polymerase sigma factor [Ardenticatenales bacterium]